MDVSLFGGGQMAAAALRGRILERLGAEPKWMTGTHDSPEIVWNSGLATTMFEVAEGAASTPDLGVLRVYTPVAAARNGDAARDVCAELNASTATVRWSVAREQGPGGNDYDEVQVSCAFVVGPHNQDTLESFALWCVREQIAVVTAHIHCGDVAEAVSGIYSRYTGFPAGDERADRHPVISFAEQVVQPSASLSADGLAGELHAAFQGLRAAMVEEGISAWFAMRDEPPLTCETPFSWDPYPQGVITHMRLSDDDPEDKPLTALIESEVIEHPALGNGLRITTHVPLDPEGYPGWTINEVNRLDTEVTGASHSFGGWTMTEKAPGCVIFLPAAFAESVVNVPLVMREILLTLARQALLARRVLVPTDLQSVEDRGSGLGLAVAADPLATFVRGPHGLAWGETGEGRNPAARVLDQIYASCVGPDSDWADTRTDGFTWWPYQQAQHITAVLHSASDAVQGVSIRIATEVRRGVPVTQETLQAVAALNAELSQAALVLHDDGRLSPGCRLYVHEGTDHWASKWAQILAAEQFITAREVSSRLSRFGEEAVSAHPFSGMRPEPDELFGIRENYLLEAANGVKAGLTPLVPLLGLCRPYPLPVSMLVADREGGLDFTWYPSQSHADLPVDPVVRGSIRRSDAGSGPGWIIRSAIPVQGDQTARARWCNERNADLMSGDDDLTAVGGWGLSPQGKCYLTTWMSPFFVPDEVHLAAVLVGNLLSYHAGVVLTALRDEPDAVTGTPLTAEQLARGLESVLASYEQVLEYPPEYRWSVEVAETGVVVSLAGTRAGGADDPALAEVDGSAFRTVLRIPLAANRAELGLLYSAFLGQSVTRIPSGSYELVPGKLDDWHVTWQHVDEGLGYLVEEGLVQWDSDLRAFRFDAGPGPAHLHAGRLEMARRYDVSGMRFSAVIPGVDPVPTQAGSARNTDILGSWRHDAAGLCYEVRLPPAAMVWGSDFTIEEVITWIGRHIVRNVRKAFQ